MESFKGLSNDQHLWPIVMDLSRLGLNWISGFDRYNSLTNLYQPLTGGLQSSTNSNAWELSCKTPIPMKDKKMVIETGWNSWTNHQY
jgi:hypothetical protein